MPVCPSRKGSLSFRKLFAFRKFIEVHREVGVLLCRSDHVGRIHRNGLRKENITHKGPKALAP
jgi:hypothetical protein